MLNNISSWIFPHKYMHVTFTNASDLHRSICVIHRCMWRPPTLFKFTDAFQVSQMHLIFRDASEMHGSISLSSMHFNYVHRCIRSFRVHCKITDASAIHRCICNSPMHLQFTPASQIHRCICYSPIHLQFTNAFAIHGCISNSPMHLKFTYASAIHRCIWNSTMHHQCIWSSPMHLKFNCVHASEVHQCFLINVVYSRNAERCMSHSKRDSYYSELLCRVDMTWFLMHRYLFLIAATLYRVHSTWNVLIDYCHRSHDRLSLRVIKLFCAEHMQYTIIIVWLYVHWIYTIIIICYIILYYYIYCTY